MSTYTVSYTSVDIILQTVPEIGSVTVITSTTLAHFAGMAESIINARLSARYTLPFPSPVPLLTTIATDLALYYVLTRKPLVSLASKNSPWLDRFKEANILLDKLVTGEIPILDENGSEVATETYADLVSSNTKNYNPTFFEGEIENWETDPDKVNDETDKRR